MATDRDTPARSKHRHSEALEAYRAAVRARPGYAAAWGNLGMTAYLLGRFEEAGGGVRNSPDVGPGLFRYAADPTASMGSLAASAAPISNASLIASRASNPRTAPLRTASVAVLRSFERRKPARSAPSVVRVDRLVDSKGRPAGPPITMARSWRNSVPLRSSWNRRAPPRGAIGKPGRWRCAGSQPRQDAPDIVRRRWPGWRKPVVRSVLIRQLVSRKRDDQIAFQ